MTEFLNSDINFDELGLDPNALAETDQSTYEPTVQGMAPPDIGNYDVQGLEGTLEWGRSKKGSLYARGTFLIVGGEFDGRRVDGFLGTVKPAYRKEGTDMDDFLHSAETYVPPANGHQYTLKEMGELVQLTWQDIRKVYVDREAYCKDCGKVVARGKKGAKKPNKEGFQMPGFEVDGVIKQSIACPLCGKVLVGRGKIAKWYVA
jgi:hypothetical protein